jgi:hypothetical protein
MSDCLLKRDWGPDFRLRHATSFRCDAKADRKEVGKERKTFPAAFSPTVQFTKLILITSGNMVFR